MNSMSSYSDILISSPHNYCGLSRILLKEEENFAGLKSVEIKMDDRGLAWFLQIYVSEKVFLFSHLGHFRVLLRENILKK